MSGWAAQLLVIASLGALALALGRAGRRVVPEVVAFLVVGIIIGPHGLLPAFTARTLRSLSSITDLSLGAVMFLIGERLRWTELRRYHRQLLGLVGGQVILTAALVGIATKVAGASTTQAILLAFIATETGALSVAATVRSSKAGGGRHTDLLMPAVAATNVVTAAMFGVMFPLLLALSGRVTGFAATASVFGKVAVASVGLGIAAGIVLGLAAQLFDTSGELLLLQIVVLVAATGASAVSGCSVVIAMLVAGLVVVNRWPGLASRLFASLRVLEPPVYLVFFVIAGAGFRLSSLPAAGEIGAAYLGARAAGKVVGALGGGYLARWKARQSVMFGTAMMPHAGLAVGLVAFVVQQAPNLGAHTATIVLASVIIFESLGPIGTRRFVDRVDARAADMTASGLISKGEASLVPSTPHLTPMSTTLIIVDHIGIAPTTVVAALELVASLRSRLILAAVSVAGTYGDSGSTKQVEAMAIDRGVEVLVELVNETALLEGVAKLVVEYEVGLVVVAFSWGGANREPRRSQSVRVALERFSGIPVLVLPHSFRSTDRGRF